VLEKVELFSENLKFATAEDYHLWLKIARNAEKIGFIDEILGELRFHAGNTGSVIKKYNAVKCVIDEFRMLDSNYSVIGKFKTRLRYGLIEYEAARNSQINRDYFKAINYCVNGIRLNPLFLKLYIVLALNIYFSFYRK
jgi:hypothetical protein